MYLNEKSWEVLDIPSNVLQNALVEFVKLYSVLAGKYRLTSVYVPAEEEPYLRSLVYTVAKWLSETDCEYRRMFQSFWQRRIIYQPEDEYEARNDSGSFLGATEAIRQGSFLLSLGSEEKWKQDILTFQFYSLQTGKESLVELDNIFSEHQTEREPFLSILKRFQTVTVYSYEDLWQRRIDLFPHLVFCPSIRRDFRKLETVYLAQIIRKLLELNHYAELHENGSFHPEFLSKTTPESEETLKHFSKEHTFTDENGIEYIASWHMRYTGMEGRIFFIPSYKNGKILVCYIGKKLPNVTYPER